MLHDVAIHDVIGGQQPYIHRKKDLFMVYRILLLAKATRGSRDARALRARRDYKLASLAAFGRSVRENEQFRTPIMCDT